jgi:uncharacterized damage-inducible protein DinB/uncharacterized protein YciI
LLTFQLAPGLDLTKLTPEHMAAFTSHAKYLATLSAKGLVAGGRTNETVDTLAVLILACDEATARAAVAGDPATRAGYLKATVHSFALLMPPTLPAVLISDTRANYDAVAKYLLDAARKMPDEGYAFRPSPDVRTFAQLVGHVAEAQYIACSLVRGEEYKPRGIEQNLPAKAELVAALETAVGFCRESWNRFVPGAMADPVTLFGQRRTKLGAMDIATAHAFEHYGNMTTYLRMKGIVPPSSAK